jgi:hypothetical protein
MGFFKRKVRQATTDSSSSSRLEIPQQVWFFLIKVVVTGHTKQPWKPGSEALVQCFVPGVQLEQALVLLDVALETEELRRVDTLRAVRYNPDDESPDIPGDYFREPLERAAVSNECTLGIFIVSQDSAWPTGN